MEVIIQTLLIGLISGLSMIAFLIVAEKSGFVKGKDLWIFGKLVYEKGPKAKAFEIGVHTVGGVFFAFLYVVLWSLYDIPPKTFPIVGLATGVIHGAFVAVTQVIVLANRDDGFKIATTHAASHAVFGLILGICTGFAQEKFEYVDRYAQVAQVDTFDRRTN